MQRAHNAVNILQPTLLVPVSMCVWLVSCHALFAGSYHGLAPTNRQSGSYGLMHFTTDKSGLVTDITTWRAGFQEEREVLVRRPCDWSAAAATAA